MELLEIGSKLLKDRISFAMATVINSKGSTPRTTASKMIILEDKTIYSTIGGGIVEAKVIEEAVQAIKEGKPRIVNYRLNADVEGGLDMQCGGSMDIFIDVYTKKPHILIVGGGHCGYALSKGVKLLGWDYSLVEERSEYNSPERFPEALKIYTGGNFKELENIETDDNTYIVIVTNDHDEGSLERVIMKKAAYIGMIGSKRKVATIMKKLIEKGISKEKLDTVYAPIGLEIKADTPEEISFSILSQIIEIKQK